MNYFRKIVEKNNETTIIIVMISLFLSFLSSMCVEASLDERDLTDSFKISIRISQENPEEDGEDGILVKNNFSFPSQEEREDSSVVFEEKADELKPKKTPYVYKEDFGQEINFLDLHGVKGVVHAQQIFVDFMERALQNNVREVTVVTGRGAHSDLKEGEYGVISTSLPDWIEEADWLRRAVKKCNLSSYGGCYTLILRTTKTLPTFRFAQSNLEQHVKDREQARKNSKSFHGKLRKKKHGEKF